MPSLGDLSKRVFVGRPLRSTQLGETLLPKRLALPVFASDALSSVAYATEEILLVLSLGGLALIHYTWYAAAGVAFLMLVVVASYRQNVHAYPSGGGDYEVATTNLGPRAGLTVASALMVDYVLTVAVSVSSGVANITSAVSSLQGHAVGLAVGLVAVITLLNLRGVRESGTAFAIPTYAFIAGVTALIAIAAFKYGTGHHLTAESSKYSIKKAQDYTGFALVFLLLRSFASGCTALTGVEAISNGVPAFQKPKSKNAATTLAMLGAIAVSMFLAITAIAIKSHVHIVDGAHLHDLVGAPHGYVQKTVIAQVGGATFGNASFGFYYLQATTALILVLAANTAFNGFPVLASILAEDGYLPRQLSNRGDRLAFSNGILLLAGFAIVLILAFSASPTRLIQLYIVGVFVSFVNSQAGMIRHWNRNLPLTDDVARRRQMKRSRVINSIGLAVTVLVLAIILVSKFVEGAWIAIVAMIVLFAIMRSIRHHYDLVQLELAPDDEDDVLPSRVHAVVLVSKVHKATLRAINYARATRPSTLVAVTVEIDHEATQRLKEEWERRGVPVPLKILDSPYREVSRQIIKYIKEINRASPRDVVSVFIPEYVVGHWWEQLLHNQNALRLKGRLLFMRGVMVTSVPYQLASSEAVVQRVRPTVGDVRLGRDFKPVAPAPPPADTP
ncbi:MAG: APC family permease [Frankiaceae bacterium]|nr:APC family permease [Frankiaceae bacterium]MBV9869784.1 APC family permease [Frankiaceae bacterium]